MFWEEEVPYDVEQNPTQNWRKMKYFLIACKASPTRGLTWHIREEGFCGEQLRQIFGPFRK